jgi:hypothetical protein
MATKLGLYNGALRVCKSARLEGLTDDVEGRYLLDDVYSGTVLFCLEAGLWNFAQRSVEISPDDSITPSWGFSFAFLKPDDYVRLVAISDSETMYPTLGNYLDEGTYWHASCNPLFVTYISNDTTDGGLNIANWPESFTRAVEHQLALEIAPHLTSMSEGQLASMEKDADRKMRTAKALDAVNQPAQRPPPGRLVQARMGYRSLGQRRQLLGG